MVLFISCICGIVLVELKLLQVLCNRSVKKMVVLKPAKEREREKKKKKKKKNLQRWSKSAAKSAYIMI